MSGNGVVRERCEIYSSSSSKWTPNEVRCGFEDEDEDEDEDERRRGLVHRQRVVRGVGDFAEMLHLALFQRVLLTHEAGDVIEHAGEEDHHRFAAGGGVK